MTRGGKRINSGRKKSPEPMTSITIKLNVVKLTKLRQIYGKKLAEKIRNHLDNLIILNTDGKF